jgi:hypothetical protein
LSTLQASGFENGRIKRIERVNRKTEMKREKAEMKMPGAKPGIALFKMSQMTKP